AWPDPAGRVNHAVRMRFAVPVTATPGEGEPRTFRSVVDLLPEVIDADGLRVATRRWALSGLASDLGDLAVGDAIAIEGHAADLEVAEPPLADDTGWVEGLVLRRRRPDPPPESSDSDSES